MQTIKPFIENVKSAGLLTIILASVAGYITNSVWSYIPAVSKIFYGDAPVAPLSSMPFNVFAWYLANIFINTIALSMFIHKKGAVNGLAVGLIVGLFFGGTAILGTYLGAGAPLPPGEFILASLISNVLFYCVPAALVGHLRKQ
jgi:hypothetical protein